MTRINWRRGFFRLWVAGSVAGLIWGAWLAYRDSLKSPCHLPTAAEFFRPDSVPCTPPAPWYHYPLQAIGASIVYFLAGCLILWIFEGFGRRGSSPHN